jgi:hypothetical protein
MPGKVHQIVSCLGKDRICIQNYDGKGSMILVTLFTYCLTFFHMSFTYNAWSMYLRKAFGKILYVKNAEKFAKEQYYFYVG